MPNRIVPIKATYESVTRLATLSVAKQVMRRTGLSEDVPVRFPGETGTDVQPGSTIETTAAKNLFEHHSKVKITVQEEYKEDAVINSAVRQHDAPYVFEDKALGVVIKPVLSYTAMTINFEYRAATRTEVEAWRNDIKVRLADNRTGMLHELDYHYEVPQFCLTVLAHLHDLRERQAGYGEDLSTYFQRCFTRRATVLTQMNGNGSLMVVAEKAIGVQGWFEFIEPTEPEKNSDSPSWTVSFNYRFNYHKPVSVNFVYPLVVHNQVIDARLFSTKRPYSLDDRPSLHTETTASYETLSDLNRKVPDPLGGHRVPEWDEWIPERVPNYTTACMTWLLQVDAMQPTMLLDLDELGCHVLEPAFREFLVHEKDHVGRRGQSLVHFTLYCDNIPLDDGDLYLDEKLTLWCKTPLNMRHTYHLRMELVTEYSLFTNRAIQAMQSHGIASLLAFQTLVPALDVVYGQSALIGGTTMTLRYIQWFFQYMRDTVIGGVKNESGFSINTPANPNYRSYYVEWPLVNILTIIATKQGV